MRGPSPSEPPTPNAMDSPEAIADAFARVGAWIERYFEHPEAYRVMPQVRPGEVVAALPVEAPETGEPFEAILADFERIIVPATTHWNHPRFFAYFATSAAPAAAREALDLQIRELGMTGRTLPALRIYITGETHSHVEKAAIALGIGRENVVRVGCDDALRMRVVALRAAIEADRDAGMRPMAVVATVGTTSTTSVDPLREIAAVAREFDVWLHVDAAYAGIAAMIPEFASIFDGVEFADSLVVNPHKWMFVPMDLSVLFLKDESTVRRAFTLVPEYLTTPESDGVNYMDYGLQLGRRFRALKLWFVLRRFGAEGIRQRLRDHIALAQEFALWVRSEPHWEVLAPHPFSVVCFRYAPPGLDEAALEVLNAGIMHAVNLTGEIFVSHTKIDGRYAIRLAIGNLRTQRSDVEFAWEILRREAQKHNTQRDCT